MNHSESGAVARASECLLGPALYVLIAVLYLVVPIGGRLSTDLLGSFFFAPDNLLNAGILEWGRRSLLSLSDPFEWPPGYPLRQSLAGTESLLGWQPAYFFLRQIGVSVAGSFNLLVLTSFVVSGVAAERFARHLGISRSGAIVSGVLFSFSHYHVALLVQFQSLSIAWMPLAFVFLDRFLRVPTWRSAVGFAATLLITGFSGIYYGIFLLVLSGGWALWRGQGAAISVQGRHVLIAAAVGVCTVLAALPGVLPYLEFAVDHGYVVQPEKFAENSVALLSFLQVPRWLALWGDGALLPRVAGGGSFPGLVLTALLVANLTASPGDRSQDGAPDLLLGVLAVACFVLSLGPYLKIYNYPTEYLGGRIPLPGRIFLLPGVRIPSRWLGCSLVFLAPLAGRGFDRLTDGSSSWRGPAACAVVCVFVAESWISPSVVRSAESVPQVMEDTPVYSHVVLQGGPIVELPVAASSGPMHWAQAYYSYAASWHGQRTVSYHASVRPAVLDTLVAAARRLPSPESRRVLADHGVAQLVLHGRFMRNGVLDSTVRELQGSGYPTTVVDDAASVDLTGEGLAARPQSEGGPVDPCRFSSLVRGIATPGSGAGSLRCRGEGARRWVDRSGCVFAILRCCEPDNREHRGADFSP